MVAFAVVSSSIMGLPTPLVQPRENEVLRSYQVSRVSASSLLGIPTLSALAGGFDHHPERTGGIALELPSDWAAYMGVLAALVFACRGLGCLIGVISANSRVAVLW